MRLGISGDCLLVRYVPSSSRVVDFTFISVLNPHSLDEAMILRALKTISR
jgi:hypothetical protein